MPTVTLRMPRMSASRLATVSRSDVYHFVVRSLSNRERRRARPEDLSSPAARRAEDIASTVSMKSWSSESSVATRNSFGRSSWAMRKLSLVSIACSASTRQHSLSWGQPRMSLTTSWR